MKVNYIHQRLVRDGQILNNGGTTIAFRELGDNQIEYALAHCSPKDNFSKALGRIKAEGRLNSPKYRVTIDSSWKEFINSYSVYFEAE